MCMCVCVRERERESVLVNGQGLCKLANAYFRNEVSIVKEQVEYFSLLFLRASKLERTG
jgi:hypothetical protein